MRCYLFDDDLVEVGARPVDALDGAARRRRRLGDPRTRTGEPRGGLALAAAADGAGAAGRQRRQQRRVFAAVAFRVDRALLDAQRRPGVLGPAAARRASAPRHCRRLRRARSFPVSIRQFSLLIFYRILPTGLFTWPNIINIGEEFVGHYRATTRLYLVFVAMLNSSVNTIEI